ncbi:IclR family transcriptional regulator [Pseudalkalibacillus sp. A8]|uniref:IclR family transcriptional regulator n=1 Tax=Pseudalkalibacillus sp. A8 TaxID=3382641 RepID=UPI0038B69E5E
MATNNSAKIKSVEYGFQILKSFVKEKEPMTLSAISKETGLHKSQLFRYLNTFVELGALNRIDEGAFPKWALGPELIVLGEAAFESIDVTKAARPYITSLRTKLNETVAFSIWRENGPFFVKWEKSNRLINIGLDTGSYVPLFTATGKVFRAFLPNDVTDPLYEKEVEKWNVDQKKYASEVEKVQRKHLSITESSLLQGITAISAPVFFANKRLAGAISVIGVQGTLDVSDDSLVVKELKQAARNISENLGYVESTPGIF